MEDPLIVTTTFAKSEDAEIMAKIVLESRLAACVQISGPVKSFYWWQGEIETAEEYAMTMKSSLAVYDELECLVLENHPYDTPEIVACKITQASNDYLAWMEKELGR